MNTLVFDIETVPDVAFGRRLFGLEGLSDDEVGKAMQAKARQDSGSDFLPHDQHRIVAISCAFRSREGFRVWSLGEESAGERELVERFFDGIDEVHARARELEWRRIRSSRCCTTARCTSTCRRASLLGNRRRRQRLPLQQLSRPIPLAASRSHGRAVRLSEPRPRLAVGCGRAAGLSRQARLRWLAGVGRLPARRTHAHPPLLRDRRHQYLACLSALPAHARPPHRRRPRRRIAAHAAVAHRSEAAALRRIPRGLDS